jgi:hypothetical protein
MKRSILWDRRNTYYVVRSKAKHVSEENIASVFWAEQYAKQQTEAMFAVSVMLHSCLDYLSTQIIEEIRFSEISVEYRKNGQHYIPRERFFLQKKCIFLNALETHYGRY